MNLTNAAIAQQLLFLFLLRFFFVISVIGFAVGVCLMLNAALMQRIGGILNRWVSMRKSTKWLNVPRDTGPVVRRYRRPIGVVFVLVAVFSLYGLITQVDTGRLAFALGLRAPREFVTLIVESAYRFLIVGNLLAIVTGVMLLVFPDTFHKIELQANHWYSFRRATLGADDLHSELDGWVARFPRTAGLAITIVALGVAVNCGVLLRALG